jgi:hypothetical protein
VVKVTVKYVRITTNIFFSGGLSLCGVFIKLFQTKIKLAGRVSDVCFRM